MRFLGEDTDIDIETEEPEFSAWKWIAPSALPDAIVPFKRDVYVAVLEAFQSHL
jgi:putative (di)nucleoside polyphosphate hydrolase